MTVVTIGSEVGGISVYSMVVFCYSIEIQG